jgi:hypothetical protein
MLCLFIIVKKLIYFQSVVSLPVCDVQEDKGIKKMFQCDGCECEEWRTYVIACVEARDVTA